MPGINPNNMHRCYYAVDNPIATIVFEDMKASGYEVADRIEGLNEEHCKVLLTKLGRYHAGGMMLLKQVHIKHILLSIKSFLVSTFFLNF